MIRSSSKVGFAKAVFQQDIKKYVSLRDLIYGENCVNKAMLAKVEESEKNSPISLKINGKFVSPWTRETEKKFIDVVKYGITRKQNVLKLNHDTMNAIKPLQTDITTLRSLKGNHFTWIGHATIYHQIEGLNLVTDPLWSDRASPFRWLGPKRYIKPPIELEQLDIDVVLLSHTHYDHLDSQTVRRIGNRALWIVPLGVKEILHGMGISNCVELNWWQSYHVTTSTGNRIEIILTPAKHWTARTMFDRNTCLWGSFAVLSNSYRYFFTGDTAYCSVFKTIGQKYGPFHLAAIPIGAYAPRWFMKDVHCDPEEAVQIHQDLQSMQSVGIHWGTFPMADEDFIEPALELARCRNLAGLSSNNFFTMAHGETICAGGSSLYDFADSRSDLYELYINSLKLDLVG
eukprot:gene12083-16169_t